MRTLVGDLSDIPLVGDFLMGTSGGNIHDDPLVVNLFNVLICGEFSDDLTSVDDLSELVAESDEVFAFKGDMICDSGLFILVEELPARRYKSLLHYLLTNKFTN